VKRLPKELADQLPEPKQIEALMMDLEQELRPKNPARPLRSLHSLAAKKP